MASESGRFSNLGERPNSMVEASATPCRASLAQVRRYI